MKHSSRRDFLTALGSGLLDYFMPPALAADTAHTLVYITLDGGIDGLNAVVPYVESAYYAARPTLAVPAPGQGDGSAIDLDGFFGLNPYLAPLKPLYDQGALAIVHATGAPYADRSHFNAIKRVQSGLTTPTLPQTGWLARHLDNSGNGLFSPFRGITVGTGVHEALRGTRSASVLVNASAFDLTSDGHGDYRGFVRSLYGSTSLMGLQSDDALTMLAMLDQYQPWEFAPDNGAVYPTSGLASNLKNAAKFIKSGLGPEVICINSSGWDFHSSMDTGLPTKLDELAQGLTSFYQDMGTTRMQQVTVLVGTEFGRRVAENASLGTDHGRGSCLFALGGRVNGGRVYADWPGLAENQLNEGDLEITTDFRTVLSEALVKLLGNPQPDRVFSDFTANSELNLFT